jgi:hypothetical protein
VVFSFIAALYLSIIITASFPTSGFGSYLQANFLLLLQYALPASAVWAFISQPLFSRDKSAGVKRVVFLSIFCAGAIAPAITVEISRLTNALLWMPAWCTAARAVSNLAGIGWSRLIAGLRSGNRNNRTSARSVVISRLYVLGWIGVWTGWVQMMFPMVNFPLIVSSGYGPTFPAYLAVMDFLPSINFMGTSGNPGLTYILGFVVLLLFAMSYYIANGNGLRALAYSLAGAGALLSLLIFFSAPYMFGFLMLLGYGVGGGVIAIIFGFSSRGLVLAND